MAGWAPANAGLASPLLGSVLGGLIGLLSGYIGGKPDLIAQRVLDILQGLPLLVLALVMSAALGPAIHNVVIAISIPIIPRAARVIRSSVLSIRERSEEHTSELQSLAYLVCRLLLEKKKTTTHALPAQSNVNRPSRRHPRLIRLPRITRERAMGEAPPHACPVPHRRTMPAPPRLLLP